MRYNVYMHAMDMDRRTGKTLFISVTDRNLLPKYNLIEIPVVRVE